MVARPTAFIAWTDGSNQKITQPPSAVCTQGFTAGQAPPYQYVNWLLYTLDQWVQYLDGRAGGTSAGGSQAASNPRLLNGGNWSANGTTLQWSATFNVAVPGQADGNNAVATAGLTVTDGQVAYVNLNVPFTYTATTTSGSTSLTNLSSTAGLTTGMTVTGAGIPASTTITVSGSTVTLSNAATASGNGIALTFQSSGTLTAQVATESSVSAGPQTVIFARNNGGVFIVGIGAGEMLLRSGESKALRGNGFGATTAATAGFAINAGQVCYISPGGSADGSRTAGSAFTTDASGSALSATPCRSKAVGIAATTTTSGQTVTLVQHGLVGGFTGLTIGGYVWLDPANGGGLTQNYPGSSNANNGPIAGNAIVLVGVAVSATQVFVRLPSGDQSVPVNPTFGTVTATQFSGNLTGNTIVANNSVTTPQLITPVVAGSNTSGRLCQWAPAQTVWAAAVVNNVSGTSAGIVTQTGVGAPTGGTWSTSGTAYVRCVVTFAANVPTSAIISFMCASPGLLLPSGYQVGPQQSLSLTQVAFYFVVINNNTLVYPTFSFIMLTGTA